MGDSIWGSIKGIIGAVAPAVASVIGTPVAGVAVKGLCNILGLNEDAGPKEIDSALQNASPETWLKIKELNAQTEVELKRLDIDSKKIDQMESSSARSREVEMAKSGFRDFTPSFLAIFLTVGFFGLLFLLMFVDLDPDVRGIIDIMLGSLGTGFITMLNYYFGSSYSSSKKDKYLAGKNN